MYIGLGDGKKWKFGCGRKRELKLNAFHCKLYYTRYFFTWHSEVPKEKRLRWEKEDPNFERNFFTAPPGRESRKWRALRSNLSLSRINNTLFLLDTRHPSVLSPISVGVGTSDAEQTWKSLTTPSDKMVTTCTDAFQLWKQTADLDHRYHSTLNLSHKLPSK